MLKYGQVYCIKCGKSFYGPLSGVLYCEKCRKKARSEAALKYQQKKKPQKPDRVLEITKLADAEGLSYGKYCLKYGI